MANAVCATLEAALLQACRVEVDRFEGVASLPGSDEAQADEDREAVRQATEAVTRYRNCSDR